MKIFLSGGSGFVGRPLLRRLRAEGRQLVAVMRSPTAAEAVRRETVRLMGCPCTVDVSRARQRLGHAPVVSIDQGLSELAAGRPESRVADLAGRGA